jgi:hypothetical protein
LTPIAPKILQHNVYGWFARVDRGLYDLTDAGRASLVRWPQAPNDDVRHEILIASTA